MAISCFKELENYGASQVLAREYGSYYQSTPDVGYDVTLKIDLQTLPQNIGIIDVTQNHLSSRFPC